MITRLKLSTIEQGLPKYRSMLAGNAAYVPSSYESIASATGTGSSQTITFSSIPGTYQHLQLRCLVRSTSTANFNNWLYFNSDTGSNYARHFLYGTGSTATVDNSTSTSGIIVGRGGITTTDTNTLGAIIIDIHDYASTTKNKTVRTFYGIDNNASDINYWVGMNSGLWMNTNAVTTIEIKCTTGSSYTTQTQFALYGVKGA